MDVAGSSLVGGDHTQTTLAVAHTTLHMPPNTGKSLHHKGRRSHPEMAVPSCQRRRWNSLLAPDQQLLDPVGGFCKINLCILWDQLRGDIGFAFVLFFFDQFMAIVVAVSAAAIAVLFLLF